MKRLQRRLERLEIICGEQKRFPDRGIKLFDGRTHKQYVKDLQAMIQEAEERLRLLLEKLS
jgi:hypothetical protein